MEDMGTILKELEALEYTGEEKDMQLLDNRIRRMLRGKSGYGNYTIANEITNLQSTSWLIHETMNMYSSEEDKQWNFSKLKHRAVHSCRRLIKLSLIKPE